MFSNKIKVLSISDKALYIELKRRAKLLKNNETVAELILWKELKNNQLGFKFRRQHIIHRFIVDFYCVEKKLVIEIDGSIHDKKIEYDKTRQNILKSLGCMIVRFSNNQVINNLDFVIEEIKNLIK